MKSDLSCHLTAHKVHYYFHWLKMNTKTPASRTLDCNNKPTPISPRAIENYCLPDDENLTLSSYTSCSPAYYQTTVLPPAYSTYNMAGPNVLDKKPVKLKAIAEHLKRAMALSPKTNYENVNQTL